jgi:hypothetical protein
LIICGLKILGKGHCQQAIDDMREAFKNESKMVVGFDMVNEEDFCPPLKDFLGMMFDEVRNNGPLPIIFHAGESVDADN